MIIKYNKKLKVNVTNVKRLFVEKMQFSYRFEIQDKKKIKDKLLSIWFNSDKELKERIGLTSNQVKYDSLSILKVLIKNCKGQTINIVMDERVKAFNITKIEKDFI